MKYIPNYTVEDYRQWQGEWELWDGIPVSMSPSPFGRHQWAATSLASSINQQLDELNCADCFVLMETDWIVDQRTVVRPDISVCCDKFPERFIESAPTLVVEVLSESTASIDKVSKRLLYESQGVSHYLMLDLVTHGFLYHRLVGRSYQEQPVGEPLTIPLHARCQIELRVPQLKSPPEV